MGILIATQTYHPTVSGQGAFTVRLAEGLAQAGHGIDVLMPSDRNHAYSLESRGVTIHGLTAIPMKPFDERVHVTLLPGARVEQILDELHPHVVHVQDHYPLCRAVVTAATQRGLPLVGTNHFLPDNLIPYVPLFGQFSMTQGILDRLLWDMVMAVFNRLDQAVAPTETAADILRRHGLQVPVRAISCGVDVERFRRPPHYDRQAFRARYGLNPVAKLFLYLGRVDREKRLDLLLEALLHLPRPDIQVVVAGKGNQLSAFKARARRLRLNDRIAFTGFIPPDDLPGLLHSADVFVQPSPAELQSIATLEALSAGLPVLLAEARALPELVLPGVNGYLFQSGDAEDLAHYMDILADESQRWSSMGLAGLSLARRHRFEHTLQRYEALYHEVNPAVELKMAAGQNHPKVAVHEPTH
jgi:1,2-diacylglycerol 3-alpha-glucosyltransferase